MRSLLVAFLFVGFYCSATTDYEKFFLSCLRLIYAENQSSTSATVLENEQLLEQCKGDQAASLVYCLSRSVTEPFIYFWISPSQEELIDRLPESLQAIAKARLKDHPLKSKM